MDAVSAGCRCILTLAQTSLSSIPDEVELKIAEVCETLIARFLAQLTLQLNENETPAGNEISLIALFIVGRLGYTHLPLRQVRGCRYTVVGNIKYLIDINVCISACTIPRTSVHKKSSNIAWYMHNT